MGGVGTEIPWGVPHQGGWNPGPIPGVNQANITVNFPPELASWFQKRETRDQGPVKKICEFVRDEIQGVRECVHAQGQWLSGLVPIVGKHEAWEPHLVRLSDQSKEVGAQVGRVSQEVLKAKAETHALRELCFNLHDKFERI